MRGRFCFSVLFAVVQRPADEARVLSCFLTISDRPFDSEKISIRSKFLWNNDLQNTNAAIHLVSVVMDWLVRRVLLSKYSFSRSGMKRCNFLFHKSAKNVDHDCVYCKMQSQVYYLRETNRGRYETAFDVTTDASRSRQDTATIIICHRIILAVRRGSSDFLRDSRSSELLLLLFTSCY